MLLFFWRGLYVSYLLSLWVAWYYLKASEALTWTIFFLVFLLIVRRIIKNHLERRWLAAYPARRNAYLKAVMRDPEAAARMTGANWETEA